jgi:hypothetical protein
MDVSHGPGCPKNLLEEAMDTPKGALVQRCFRILKAKNIGLTITLDIRGGAPGDRIDGNRPPGADQHRGRQPIYGSRVMRTEAAVEGPKNVRSPGLSYGGWDSRHVLLYVAIGFAFFVALVLSVLIDRPAELKGILRDIAIAIGPVWMLGILYQHFLFREIRQASTEASADALLALTGPLLEGIRASAREVQTEVENMMNLRELGIERAFKRRIDALPLVCEWLSSEKIEVAFVGTSLRGLFWSEVGSEQIAKILGDRLKEEGRTCRFKFLLTHPAFADLRQGLERIKRPEDFRISAEIRTSVGLLLKMGAKPEEIHFVKATPTCFAIKTSAHMLLNPCPLENQSLASFCLIVGNQEGRNRVYSSFEENHFIFESASCVRLKGGKPEDLDAVFNQSLESLGLVRCAETSAAAAGPLGRQAAPLP